MTGAMTDTMNDAAGGTDVPDRTINRQLKDSAVAADNERVTAMTSESMTIEVLDYV